MVEKRQSYLSKKDNNSNNTETIYSTNNDATNIYRTQYNMQVYEKYDVVVVVMALLVASPGNRKPKTILPLKYSVLPSFVVLFVQRFFIHCILFGSLF